ncbi:hypothetical protein NDU88_003477, partial [Pleurodeles waltl]
NAQQSPLFVPFHRQKQQLQDSPTKHSHWQGQHCSSALQFFSLAEVPLESKSDFEEIQSMGFW